MAVETIDWDGSCACDSLLSVDVQALGKLCSATAPHSIYTGFYFCVVDRDLFLTGPLYHCSLVKTF